MFGVKSKAQRECDAWNKKYAGKPIETRLVDGYNVVDAKVLGIGDEDVRFDHLIWLRQTGIWPDHGVIHINGDRSDDRWANLRLK